MNWNQALFPSLKRRGGCATKKMSRSNLRSRRRGGAKRKPDRAQPQEKIGEIFRPEEFTELTTPSAALRRLRAFLLMPQPPLLFKEGKLRGAPPLAVSVITQERPQDPLDRALAGASAAHQFLFPLLQALSKFTKSGGANGPAGLREHVGFLFFRVMFHEIFQHLCFCRKFI